MPIAPPSQWMKEEDVSAAEDIAQAPAFGQKASIGVPPPRSKLWAPLGWIILIVLAFGLLVLPLPPLKGWLAWKWSEEDRAWLEYASYASEILLVAMFGEAIYSKSFGEWVKKICASYQERIDQGASSAQKELSSDVAIMLAFWTGDRSAKTLKGFAASIGGANRLRRKFQSYPFLLLMLFFGIGRALPGGLYGFLALSLALVHFGAEALMMQDIASAG